jgi:hypothetical protein
VLDVEVVVAGAEVVVVEVPVPVEPVPSDTVTAKSQLVFAQIYHRRGGR